VANLAGIIPFSMTLCPAEHPSGGMFAGYIRLSEETGHCYSAIDRKDEEVQMSHRNTDFREQVLRAAFSLESRVLERVAAA